MTSQARLAAQTQKSGFNNCELGAKLNCKPTEDNTKQEKLMYACKQ